MDEESPGRRKRGLVLAGIVLVVGLPVTGFTWLSERNVDQQAEDLADDLRRAGRQVDDATALSTEEVLANWDETTGERPLVEALGHDEAFAGYAIGSTGISVAYETSWGLATRCVHLLLRDDVPVRTEIADSATCRPLQIE